MPVKTFNMFRELTKFETWLWIGGIELLVMSFFDRIFLTGLLLALIGYEYYVLKGVSLCSVITLSVDIQLLSDYEFYKIFLFPDKKEKLEPFFKWSLNCAILAIYPALPLVDKDSNNILLL